MAEEERLTKKERRARARAERKRKEAEQAKRAQRQRLTTIVVSVLVVAGIATIVVSAFAGGDGSLDEAIVLGAQDAEQARAEAGCEIVDQTPLPDSSHLDPATAPPADALYTSVRPTHSGPHYASTHPLVRAGSDTQLDERATTHNLEHGSVMVWYDPAQVDDPGELESWSETMNNAGFALTDAGRNIGVFVSPYTDPGISSGKAVAFRGWGVAMDCDSFDEAAANSFLIDFFGTHGSAPEAGAFAPYPEDVLRYGDAPEPTEDGTDTTTGTGTDTGTGTGADTGTSDTGTDGGTGTGTPEPTETTTE